MADPFVPEPEELPPMNDQFNLEEVTPEEAEAVAMEWAKNPPDKAYDGILLAAEKRS